MRDGGQAQTVFIKSRWIVRKRDVAVDFDGTKCGFLPMDEVRAGLGGDAARGLLGRVEANLYLDPSCPSVHAVQCSHPFLLVVLGFI